MSIKQPAKKFPLELSTQAKSIQRNSSPLRSLAPRSQRTYTPSLAVLAQRGSYHWTPEGRKLADFSSGVLVANLGPQSRAVGGKRVLGYMGLDRLRRPKANFFRP